MAKQKELPPEVPPELPPSPAGDPGPTPKFETPETADAGGPVPRTVKPIARVAEHLRGTHKRFKLRCTNYEASPVRYVLARSEKEAREHYLESEGLNRQLAQLQEDGVEKAEKPRLSVTVLPD
jgi:hypothetical protein